MPGDVEVRVEPKGRPVALNRLRGIIAVRVTVPFLKPRIRVFWIDPQDGDRSAFFVTRFLLNGTPDPAWGGGSGVLIDTFAGARSNDARAIVIQNDGATVKEFVIEPGRVRPR